MFRFRLRTLFVVITLLCLWLGWQVKIVRDRQTVRQQLAARGAQIRELPPPEVRQGISYDLDFQYAEAHGPPWYRVLLGDVAVATIYFPKIATEDLQQASRYFPEATVLTNGGLRIRGNQIVGGRQ